AGRVLSREPLSGPLPDLELQAIDWVIVGGESGPGGRPIDQRGVREIRLQCRRRGSAFFFKQWGGAMSKSRGRMLDGHTYDALPKPRRSYLAATNGSLALSG